MISLVLGMSVAHATTVNVDPSSDINALTSSLTPGTTVVFADGVYQFDGVLDWTGVGTSESDRITLQAGVGAHPVLQTRDGWIVAQLEDSAFVTIEGLTFSGTDEYFASGSGYGGLRIRNTSNVIVRNCVFTNIGGTAVGVDGNTTNFTFQLNEISNTTNGSGLTVGCGDASCWMQDSVISNNWIHDLGGDWGYGMLFESGTQNVEVAHNVVHGMIFRGIQVESTEYGEPNRVHGNVVFQVGDQGDDVAIGVYGASIVQNNLIFDVIGRGMRVGQDGDRPFEHVAVSFNTIVNTTDWGLDLSDFAGHDGMVLANNVVANPVTRALRVQEPDNGGMDASVYLSHNVLTGYVEGLDATLYPTAVVPGSGFADFKDVAAWDFYPATGSPLIDSADPSGESYIPDDDFNAMPRDGSAPDVGAYEVVAQENPGWAVAPEFKTLTDGTIPPVEVGGCCKKNKDTAVEGLLALPLLGLALLRRRKR